MQRVPVAVPEGVDSASAASLTETLESEHFVFRLEPGDNVWIERSEAYHDWAVGYLGVAGPSIRLFEGGLTVAHEFDQFKDD